MLGGTDIRNYGTGNLGCSLQGIRKMLGELSPFLVPLAITLAVVLLIVLSERRRDRHK